jgi:hypothetical protein
MSVTTKLSRYCSDLSNTFKKWLKGIILCFNKIIAHVFCQEKVSKEKEILKKLKAEILETKSSIK